MEEARRRLMTRQAHHHEFPTGRTQLMNDRFVMQGGQARRWDEIQLNVEDAVAGAREEQRGDDN